MRRTIETAPRDGHVIIVEDDVRGSYDVAHWSAETGEWVGENGDPTKLTPSHWYPMQGDNFQQGFDVSSSSGAGRPASRTRRHGRLPFSLWRAAPQRSATTAVIAPRSVASATPTTVAAVKARATAADAKRRRHVRRVFAIFPIAATLLAVALIGMYFHAKVASYVTGYPGLQDIFRQEIQASRDWWKTDLSALRPRAKADKASAQPAQEAAQIKHAVEASAPEARQSLEMEPRSEVSTNELAEARSVVDELNLKLQAEAARNTQSLEQERERTAALARDAAAARQELTAGTELHRRALEEERARGAALASELATARREIETREALSSKRDDEAAQFKKAVERATAELRQSLQQEHDRAEALASELAKARRDVETQVALSSKRDDEAAQLKKAAESAAAEQRQSLRQEHDRAEALASELATARREIEAQVALSGKRGEEAAQLKKAAESATAEQRQSLRQEHDKSEALTSELATARRALETQAALLNKARDDAAQFKQTAERTAAELQQERDRAEASSRELAIARREIETNVALNKARDYALQFKQTEENTTAEMQERDSANALSPELAMARESAQRAIDTRIPLELVANSQPAQMTEAAEVVAMEQPAAAEAQNSPEAARLIARASALLGQGNIGSARIVLERAAEGGSAQANFMLAETYDPAILSAWGTYGTRGEATKAREFYAKAHAGGIQEAEDRYNALR